MILPPQLSRMSHANVKHKGVERVLPNTTAPQKRGSTHQLKRNRTVIDSDSDHDPDSQVGNKKKHRKKSKRDIEFEYNSEEDIAQRNNFLKMLFS